VIDYRDPLPKYISTKDGNVIEVDNGSGSVGGPTVGGVPVTASTPFESVKQRIINHEAPEAVGGYNALAYNVPGRKNAAGLTPVNLTGMTMGEVVRYQTGTMRPKTKGRRGGDDVGSTGVGAYQFESRTLAQNAAKTFGKDWQSVPFTPENQDRIAETLWNTVRGNPTALGNTWAAFKNQAGASSRVVYSPQAGGSDSAVLDPGTMSMMAEQYLAGDKSVLQNLGRGAQGSGNIVKQRAEIAKQARASGMTGRDIAAQMADFSGILAGERAAGTRMANIESAVSEAQRVIPLALAASEALPRSGFVPVDKAIQAYQSGTNNVALRRFAAANQTLVNVYARAISPTGVPTVSGQDHARELLSTAFDQPSYKAVIGQMQQEIAAARNAPHDVRAGLHSAIAGRERPDPVRVASPDQARALPPGTRFVTPDGRVKVRP
jgi:hypothetical protein